MNLIELWMFVGASFFMLYSLEYIYGNRKKIKSWLRENRKWMRFSVIKRFVEILVWMTVSDYK